MKRLIIGFILVAGISFINNRTINGQDRLKRNVVFTDFDSTPQSDGDYQNTGCIINKGFNKPGTNISFFFSDELAAHPGVYVFVNNGVETDVLTTNILDHPLGDFIYNPYQDHYLASYYQGSGDIEILQINNDYTLSSIGSISTGGAQHNRHMYISPDGKLYIASGLHKNDNQKILVYNAENYQHLETIDLGQNFGSLSDFFPAYLMAKFEHSSYDGSVFAIITAERISELSDQNTPTESVDELFVRIFPNENHIVPEGISGLLFDMKCIFGQVIISSTSTLWFYDINNSTFTYHSPMPNVRSFSYDKHLNTIYGLGPALWNYFEPGVAKIYRLRMKEVVQWEEIGEVPEFVNTIQFVPENRMLYAYSHFENLENNDGSLRVHTIDVKNNNSLDDVYLHQEGLDRMDDVKGLISCIVYDSYNHDLIIPNGGHSSLSVLGCSDEVITIMDNHPNWRSFPRLVGNPDQGFDTETLLSRTNPFPTEKLNMLGKIPENNSEFSAKWEDLTGWFIDDEISSIYSSFGYKIQIAELEYDEISTIRMDGDRLDENEDLYLYKEEAGGEEIENWVGYFIPAPQHILDALPPEVIVQTKYIKGQNWACLRIPCTDNLVGSNDDCYPPNTCLECFNAGAVDYGDMFAMEVCEDIAFSFNGPSAPPPSQINTETSYYSYQIQDDYLPILVELNNNDQPLEIGAFANDSCVGGGVVLQGDTLVLVQAYYGGASAELSFEKYYGPAKSTSSRISDYSILNYDNGNFERRTIHTSERSDYFYVRLESGNETNILSWGGEKNISVVPNPVKGSATITFVLSEAGHYELALSDLNGRTIGIIASGSKDAGTYSFEWNRSSTGLAGIPAGLYFLSYKAGQVTESFKLVIIP